MKLNALEVVENSLNSLELCPCDWHFWASEAGAQVYVPMLTVKGQDW